MGEYVIDTGIDVTMDFCDSLEEPIILGPFFKGIGFDADNCPPGIGVYGSEGYQIPMEQLPDGFMPNNYKIILDIFHEDQNLIILHLFSKQGAYDLIIEDVTTAEYSEEYLNEPDIYVDDNFKLVINLTIVKQFPSTTAGRLSLMGASMGEYVVDTGIDVTMNFCEFVEEPIVIGPLFQAIGFDPNHCPPDVGVYGTENYEPITEGMPDDFPPNMYRTVLDIYTEEQKILILHIFSKINGSQLFNNKTASDGIEEPIMIGPMLQALGFTVDNCPPGVGVYQFEGYKIPKDNLPDDFPSNNYKVSIEIFYGEQKIIIVEVLMVKGDFDDVFVEDVNNPFYNEEYVTEPDIFLDNDNKIVLNFSIIKQPPEGTQGHFIIQRASIGEYVVDTGIDVTMDLCNCFEELIMIGPIFRALRFTADNCPPDVGVYQCEGYEVQKDTLPDDIPPYNYKVTLEIFYDDEMIIILEGFAKVT
ncbi:Protein of unknown function [Cotesia congregata]|uniref:Uncharacterized protein n=1 Tax=Cotesia congregata TaxID=51543 RepID=A0A8J2MSD2_COTCN|nr:Protein of unknown function [Cotesia congregata]